MCLWDQFRVKFLMCVCVCGWIECWGRNSTEESSLKFGSDIFIKSVFFDIINPLLETKL